MKDKLLSYKKFPIILGCTAVLIALCAAFFSVYGIGTLFAGASIAAMIMASSLELGKLVGTTFLYRYWSKTKTILKTYLCVAVFLLMVITSLGIFGYLSAAYQKSSIEFSLTQDKIKIIEEQKPLLKDRIDSSKRRIDELVKLRATQESRLSEMLTNTIIARNPIQLKVLQQQTIDIITQTDDTIKEENTRIQRSMDELQKLDEKIGTIKLGNADKKDIQTFKFVADALGVSLDKVAKWFIIFIITVFDPLAICLILAYNVAAYKKEDESVYDFNEKTQIAGPQIPLIEVPAPAAPVIEQPSNLNPPLPAGPPPPACPPTPAELPAPAQHHVDSFGKGYFKL